MSGSEQEFKSEFERIGVDADVEQVVGGVVCRDDQWEVSVTAEALSLLRRISAGASADEVFQAIECCSLVSAE